MAQFPLEVEINPDVVDPLVKLYTKAYQDIVAQFEYATDFRKTRINLLARQIRDILTELGVDTSDWIDTTLPNFYKDGSKDAIEQLQTVGAKVGVKAVMTKIDRASVAALIAETQKSFGDSLTTVNRNAGRLLAEATKRQIQARIAQGRVSGDTLREIKRTIMGILQDEGIDALVDRGGTSWSLDRYSEMLTRTKIVEARNTGLANKMLQNGYDLVQVSKHNSTHQACAVWEGKILSITGETDGYPTVDTAKSTGLFHPNCKHAINVIVMELAQETNAYETQTTEEAQI